MIWLYTCFRGSRVARFRYSLILLNVVCGALLGLAANFGPTVVISFFKVVASLALACLLAFVVLHSLTIGRLLIARFQALLVSFFPLAIRAPIGRASNDDPCHKFNEPSLRSLFQRPPPVLFL
jgi:hypothetical protein